jgi:hypothetical protein
MHLAIEVKGKNIAVTGIGAETSERKVGCELQRYGIN